MIGLGAVYVLAGLLFGAVAVVNFRDRARPRRFQRALFWGLYSITFLFGSLLPPFITGCLAIAMVVAASRLGGGGAEELPAAERRARAARFGDKLFIPALMLPLLTFAGTVAFKYLGIGGQPLVEPKDATLAALGVAVVAALLTGAWMLRERPVVPLLETRRLLDAVGAVAALPQLLAALGAMFAVAGVGKVVAEQVGWFIPVDNAAALVVAYCLGMAFFTLIMGNAFAAFPVMTAAVGLPLIVLRHHGDPAVMGAIGMLAGYCGTLMTPMAANFNMVPSALLELKDPYGVIKAQIPTGLVLLVVNIFLMYFLVFRT